MVVRVKTTVDIAETVLNQAKVIAAREGITLRALIEEGLQHVIDERQQQETGFRLRDASYGSGGGVAGIDPDDWMSIKHLVRDARA